MVAIEVPDAQIGKPVDRGRWGMTSPTSNACYNPLLNEIVFPAGILQPPAFGVDVTDAVNYGAIGVAIGHEISHGFDDQGAQYDARGRLRNWWAPADLAKFRERGQCVVDQFEGYFIEPEIHHNGKLVLGEATSDLAGARLAYRAFLKSLEGQPPAPTIDGFTPEQQFFIAWGQFRGDAIRPETQRLMVQGGPVPDGEVPCERPALEHAGVPEGFRLSGRGADGAPPREALRGLVDPSSSKRARRRAARGGPVQSTAHSGSPLSLRTQLTGRGGHRRALRVEADAQGHPRTLAEPRHGAEPDPGAAGRHRVGEPADDRPLAILADAEREFREALMKVEEVIVERGLLDLEDLKPETKSN